MPPGNYLVIDLSNPFSLRSWLPLWTAHNPDALVSASTIHIISDLETHFLAFPLHLSVQWSSFSASAVWRVKCHPYNLSLVPRDDSLVYFSGQYFINNLLVTESEVYFANTLICTEDWRLYSQGVQNFTVWSSRGTLRHWFYSHLYIERIWIHFGLVSAPYSLF